MFQIKKQSSYVLFQRKFQYLFKLRKMLRNDDNVDKI